MQSGSQQSATKPSGPALRLLQKMASLYGRGDLGGAEEACRQLLQLDPGQADALHVLGLVAWRRGEREQALTEIRKAVASDPRKPQPHNSLGVMLKDLGDLAGAEAAFRTAIDLMPDYPEALTNLGNILCETGRLADAEATHRRAIELAPQYADGHNNLATVLAKQERWEAATTECRIAVDLLPSRADFHINFGNALSAAGNWEDAATAYRRAVELAPDNVDAHENLGLALYQVDRPQQAAAAYRIATNLRPDDAHIWANLAAAQVDIDDPDAALESCRAALSLRPDLPEAHNSRGLAFKAKGLPSESLAAFETAIRLRPDYHKAYNNLGIVLQSLGRYPDAFAAYAKAKALAPDFADALSNEGMLHLLLGDFERGWRGYERMLDIKRPRARVRYRQFEMWEGVATSGDTILVSSEQGVGDQIMFASLLPDLVERGANLVVTADNRLHALLNRSIGGLTLLSDDDLTPSRVEHLTVDYQTPIGSLSRWLRPNLAAFPLRPGFLRANPSQAAILRQRYRELLGSRPLIGVSWRGGLAEAGRRRSIPLAAWGQILGQREFAFVSLQYGECAAELAAVQCNLGVDIFRDIAVDPLKSLEDFAAQTAAMDLVISIDNSTVHMAGALNVPVWVLLPAVPDWRWMLDRSNSPWYSSVRLFRQPAAGEWAPVIEAVAREMQRTSVLGSAAATSKSASDPSR